MKEKIKKFILDLGVDDVGFAKVEDYHSPKSYPIASFLPEARTIISLVFQELDTCESPSVTIAMNGRLDMNSFQRSCSYQINRFLKREFRAKVVDMPYSYPMELHKDRPAIADFSQRHAAVAAGMGTFGRHNLVIHPRFGTRIGLTALITNLEIEPNEKIEQDLCRHCDLCVRNCPAGALDEAGKTSVGKCIRNSQPYGLGANIAFWQEFSGSSPEEQKNMFMEERYGRLQQAGSMGMQYYCFNCMKFCPVGVR
ncbi:4Fe-4S binding protein [Desulfitobacterium chlororespirans]|uniref:Epoxyqueuosine reductase QueG (Queuosine biosynthesis) n=1 Tax=Desulfitobacterium chlororespirans DSM 11544 TaxID=1121395 RepID=A0A1M7SKP9_9FIRM|nr:4Fe-4S binding protein [Desulfitobacterium chlororespirans]SHN59041.1 Epoxyqueuosine reductase QueG (queuosine biosynthesis) [Desulfitobacterium chlororespirans DSM 11544]